MGKLKTLAIAAIAGFGGLRESSSCIASLAARTV